MIKEFEYLKQEFPNKYISTVLEHKAVNKALTFLDDENQYILFTGMFPEVNGPKSPIISLIASNQSCCSESVVSLSLSVS